jgi:hypothetical protein
VAVPEERLHKGLGVRRADLARTVAGDFAARLHIFDDDQPEVILAKVIWQLSAVIRRVAADDPKSITLLRAVYNLDQDPELNQLELSERLKVLSRRHGTGWHPSTTNSRLSELRGTLYPELKTCWFDWPDSKEIDSIATSEARYAAEHNASALGTFLLPKDNLGQMIADLNGTGRRGLERALPQADLYFSVTAEGNLVTTTTTEFGESLPAFTSATLLRQYQQEVRAPGTDLPKVATGRDIVDLLLRHGRVGLAVNPLGGYGADVGQLWTPEELESL